MLGKLAVLCVALAGCAHNVSQNGKTGEDGNVKGAVPLTFDNGEATVTGIVTYPGGDRTDWKEIEVPEGLIGHFDFKLTWTPPRPGLQLAFDVLDEYYVPVVDSKKQSKKRRRGRIRTASLDHATGKYFVRVYAVGRGDAGKYRLTVEYAEEPPIIKFDVTKLEIPDPPHLPELEQPTFICTQQNFDATKQECQGVCPLVGAPPNWPGCAGQCPTPPDVEIPSCQKAMPCPTPPDRRVAKCKPYKKFFPPCPDPANPDPDNPLCDGVTVPPQIGRIVGKEVKGTNTIITISVGADKGVKEGWTCAILQGMNAGVTAPTLSGGQCTIIRVDKKTTTASTSVTPDQVTQNNVARLKSP